MRRHHLFETDATRELRDRLAQLRKELEVASGVYRDAVARGDSQKAIHLLRARSLLLRQVLDTQSELLLWLRTERPEAPAGLTQNASDLPAARPAL